MKLTLRDQQFATKGLTKLYIGALTTVALLAIFGQLFIQFALIQQSSDANIINIAGRQRMLSQKLTKAALALFVISDPATQNNYLNELQTTLSLWQQSHTGLQHGNAQLGLPGNNSKAVTQLFASIEPNFQMMSNTTQRLLAKAHQDQQQGVSNTVLHTDILPSVQILLNQEPTFLIGMNTIVSQYQKEAEERVTTLKLIEVSLLGLTLLTLLLEGYFIFQPAINRLNNSLKALVNAEAQVAAHLTELEQRKSDLELALSEAMSAHRKVMPHARVVSFGAYQVQGIQGNYYNVTSQEANNTQQLVCECLMYERNLICSHSLAAATLHSALLRQRPYLAKQRFWQSPEVG